MPLFLFTILLFLGSFLVSSLILKGIESFWKRYQILDRPHLYKSEQGRKPVPYSA